jgi:hypothetical protein
MFEMPIREKTNMARNIHNPTKIPKNKSLLAKAINQPNKMTRGKNITFITKE